MSQRIAINLAANYEQAIAFDGSTNYASVTHADFSITTALSFGGWILMTTAGQGNAKLISNGSYKLELNSAGSRPQFTVAGQFGTAALSNPVLADLGWHHVVIVYDLVNSSIYVDGQLAQKEAHGNALSSGTTIAIGADSDGSAKFNGKMKYIFICAQALSSAEVTDIYGFGPVNNGLATYLSTRSVKGLWSFNNVYTDLSGLSHTLTATGTPAFGNVSGSSFGRGLRTAA